MSKWEKDLNVREKGLDGRSKNLDKSRKKLDERASELAEKEKQIDVIYDTQLNLNQRSNANHQLNQIRAAIRANTNETSPLSDRTLDADWILVF